MSRTKKNKLESVSPELFDKAVKSYGKPDFLVESAAASCGVDTKTKEGSTFVKEVVNAVDSLPSR